VQEAEYKRKLKAKRKQRDGLEADLGGARGSGRGGRGGARRGRMESPGITSYTTMCIKRPTRSDYVLLYVTPVVYIRSQSELARHTCTLWYRACTGLVRRAWQWQKPIWRCIQFHASQCHCWSHGRHAAQQPRSATPPSSFKTSLCAMLLYTLHLLPCVDALALHTYSVQCMSAPAACQHCSVAYDCIIA